VLQRYVSAGLGILLKGILESCSTTFATWVMLGFLLTAIPSLTGPECVGSLLTLDPPINLRAYDQYENWFDTNSSMRLAQSGVYKGVNDIKEYVSFIYPGSPYIASRGTFRTDSGFVSFDAETRTCVVMTKVISPPYSLPKPLSFRP
jgi:hypothetical protein